MFLLRLLLVLACLASPLAWAQEAKPPPAAPDLKPPVRPLITVECLMVTVPARVLPVLLPNFREDARAPAALAALQAMELRGEATRTANLLTRGMLGMRLFADSGKEFEYATAYEAPTVPEITLLEKPSPEALKNWPHVGIVPAAFDTRKLGQTLEIEVAVTADPKVFECSYVLEHVRFEHMNRMDAGRLPDGERLFVEQPCFSSMKDMSNTQMESGQSRLVGVHRLPGPERKFELFILTLTVSPAKKP